MKRSSGILMPISSLPSPYGIGTLGKSAYEFVDFLSMAGQNYWQLLPLGPTSYGDSPYSSFSTYAGNPYYIDPDMLIDEGLLKPSEVESVNWGDRPDRVDYGKIYEGRYSMLRRAFARGAEKYREQVAAFRAENADWVESYGLYMAVKAHFGMAAWTQWPDEGIRMRRPEAVAEYGQKLKEDVDFYIFLQFLFFEQWNALRQYAKDKNVSFIGDIPIYVLLDSADVWGEPQFFQLNEENMPVEVAGVPPDFFNADGQLWGNPLYDWDKMKQTGFEWWIQRLKAASRMYDVVRLDHFRGFESYWAIPAGDATAANGCWKQGPGLAFIQAIQEALPNLDFIAEDLGYVTPEVRQLQEDSGYPGMKVMEFAFDSREAGNYLPHLYPVNSVCYSGTHDNLTMQQWFDEAAPADVAEAKAYMGLSEEEGYVWGMIRGCMGSVSKLCVIQMQDYLELGGEARMNFPGTLTNKNWTWRAGEGFITPELTRRILQMTRRYGRN